MFLDMVNITAGLDLIFSVGFGSLFLAVVAGLFIGTVCGALPGITGTLAVALLLTVTYYFPPVVGIMFLCAIYTGSLYGGGVCSTIINIPGTPAAVCTAFDGYPMTKQGKCEEALGYGLMASIIGTAVSYGLLFFFMHPLGLLSLSFGPPEMILVVVFALSIIGALGGNIIKSFIGGAFGLLLGSIGPDFLAIPRGTYGFLDLMDGIPLVPALVGIFAIPEIFHLFETQSIVDPSYQHKISTRRIVGAALDTLTPKHWINLIRSSLIGFIIGVIPATGGTVSSMISYIQAKLYSKTPEMFGKGNPEGIIASETGNNAAEGGAIGIMMSFGIPGSGTAAVLIGAFIIHGITPGPTLVREHMNLAYAIIFLNIASVVLLLPLALLIIPYMARAAQCQTKFLIPVISALTFVGAYAERLIVFDIAILFALGLVGYVMRKLGYPAISVILGLILSKPLEASIIRTYRIYDGKYLEILSHPAFLFMLALVILSIVFSQRLQRLNKQRVEQ